MKTNRDKKNLVITILSIVIVILILAVLYFFVVKPSINKYVFNKQIEAQTYVFADMVNQLRNKGFYQVQIGNQALVLVPPQALPQKK